MRNSESAHLITYNYFWKLVSISIIIAVFNSSISIYNPDKQTKTHAHTQQLSFNNIRALRSRSLRDGSLPHKGRFATFVRSSSALRASKRPLKISYLKSEFLITPFCRWNQVNPTIFEICLLYENNNNKYLN